MTLRWDDSELRSLTGTFDASTAATQAKAKQVVAKAAADIEAHAKTRAPVDTGNLQSSISATNQGLPAEVGPTAHHAGSAPSGPSRMAAQPYMVPALDAVDPAFVAAITQLGGEVLG